MHDKELYATILGVKIPWVVREVEVRAELAEVEVLIGYLPVPYDSDRGCASS